MDATRAAAAAAGSAASVTARPIDEQVGAGIERLPRRRGAGLVVVRGAVGPDAGHDDREPRARRRGLAHVARRAHDAAAAALDGSADPLRAGCAAGAPPSLVSTVTASAVGVGQARALGALGKPFDAGAQHRHAAGAWRVR